MKRTIKTIAMLTMISLSLNFTSCKSKCEKCMDNFMEVKGVTENKIESINRDIKRESDLINRNQETLTGIRKSMLNARGERLESLKRDEQKTLSLINSSTSKLDRYSKELQQQKTIIIDAREKCPC